MGIDELPVHADIYGHTIGFAQPPPELLGQRRFLGAGEAAWQGRIDVSGHHGIPSAVVGFHAIPEILPLHGSHAGRQEQGKRGDVLLLAVVRHEPGAEV